MLTKRVWFILFTIQLGIALLIGRIIQIQLVSTESFSKEKVNLIEASVAQRTQEMVLDDGRGTFIDRNGKPLMHDYIPTLVLFPFLKKMDWPIEKLATIINVSANVIQQALQEQKQPFIFMMNNEPLRLTETQMKKINQLRIPGVFAVKKQYPLEKKYAEHLIGLIRENPDLLRSRYPDKMHLSPKTKIGISGLQGAFDEFLIPDGETRLLYHVDGDGGPLFGLQVKYSEPANPFYPVSVQTTIDRDLQEIAQEVVREHGLKKGGLVLLDVETNDILAMVSVPEINTHDPYADNDSGNQMILPQIPGSIFKTVIAAAAIEQGLVSPYRTFDCSKTIDGKPEENHNYGMLNFADSFALSCNNTFGTLGKELVEQDKDIIEKYAQKLGLYPLVSWKGHVYHFENFKQLPEEKKGIIWHDNKDKYVPLAVAQTAIGQKDVRISPLAVANMMATIARNGEAKQVRAVNKILYKNGTTFFSFPEQKFSNETISYNTALTLQKLLRSVVTHEEGTGRRFQTLPYEVAGKSGTAETGKITSHDEELINKWFAGFFPADSPKYALVVVELEQTSNKAVTNDVFYDVVKRIYEFNEQHS
ncbi:cell division protein FtsI/penicillin-binding protein 2 [Anoxybacillus calidus]|jgi:penicillin-binding protein 4B|uniref:Cell division protein FtsI/penicillin-binding protein 2 n=1 Tax=[Anoxybacillus] calidus TaxID=575178 RepID=A0A7V9YWL3_9BACL|nr:penicillin-binding protein 2 [Anoxybacillus calidus]MBA2869794.1 cell division protein FtsI/penicillin-binding protein 2 [Anoxybacillus calidus]